MRIGPWEIPESTDALISFSKRLSSAAEIRPQQIELIGPFHAKIAGSSSMPYDVTLEMCSCSDFSFGRASGIPCKHIIRLALETGQTDGIPIFDRDACMKHDFQSEIAHIKDLWASGIIPSVSFHKTISAIADIKKEAAKNRSIQVKSDRHMSQVNTEQHTAKPPFAITGTPVTGKLMDILEAVVDRGYICVPHCSKDTSFLLVFDNPSEAKLSQAKSLGIPVVYERSLQECLKTGAPFV